MSLPDGWRKVHTRGTEHLGIHTGYIKYDNTCRARVVRLKDERHFRIFRPERLILHGIPTLNEFQSEILYPQKFPTLRAAMLAAEFLNESVK